MVGLGAGTLVAALCFSIYTVVAALWSTRGDRRFVVSARRSIYAVFVLLTVSVVVLELAFLRSDFSVKLVADHSSTTTPTLYKVTAMWGSQGGSLLLWAWVLAGVSSLALFLTRGRHREVVPWATAVLGGIAVFFCGLMLVGEGANPFARLSPAPVEGVGLNPLLRHPMMAFHPPMLYTGYVAFSIPFAFAIGALISRRLDASWIRSTRRFALLAWICLSVGILLGARWSYDELGWGGYWAWDAVENASLMPWLVGTAFLHSIMVQERRGMLRVWNVSLIVATFALALTGTFLVRSGVIDSIHAFGASTVGPWLLGLIAVVVIGSSLLIISRLRELRSERQIESLASRESIFLVNNLLLVGLAVIIFWGTFFPLISEALTGDRSVLAAPWFDRYTAPIAILLVLFTGIGPLLAWRRVSTSGILRAIRIPVAAALVSFVSLAVLGVGSEPLALVTFAFCAFTIAAVVQEIVRAAVVRRRHRGGRLAGAVVSVFGQNRRRFGGYTVHAGIALLFIGIAASSSFQTSRDVRLAPGESASVGSYEVTYTQPTSSVDPIEQKVVFGGMLELSRDGERVTTLHPERNYYSVTTAGGSRPVRGFFEGEATSEVAKIQALDRDVWTAMRPDLEPYEELIAGADRRLARLAEGMGDDEQAGLQIAQLEGLAVRAIADRYVADPVPVDFRVNVNPFVAWLWLGALLALCGGMIAVWPAPSATSRQVRAAARDARSARTAAAAAARAQGRS